MKWADFRDTPRKLMVIYVPFPISFVVAYGSFDVIQFQTLSIPLAMLANNYIWRSRSLPLLPRYPEPPGCIYPPDRGVHVHVAEHLQQPSGY